MANEFAVKSSLVAEQGEREIAPVVLLLLYHDYLKTYCYLKFINF